LEPSRVELVGREGIAFSQLRRSFRGADEHKGGFFKIASLYQSQHKQMYLCLNLFLNPKSTIS
jgi:hypothetical protein